MRGRIGFRQRESTDILVGADDLATQRATTIACDFHTSTVDATTAVAVITLMTSRSSVTTSRGEGLGREASDN